jgi:insulysin
LRESANPRHPFSNFSTGTLETLEVPDIRAKLLDLWRERYDPAASTACLVSSRPLDDLETLAAATFGAMAYAGAGGPFADVEAAAREPLFADAGVVHERVPVRELRTLQVFWPLPFGLRGAYENGGERLVSTCLGHEGPNSLLAHLKRKGLAHGLSAGASATPASDERSKTRPKTSDVARDLAHASRSRVEMHAGQRMSPNNRNLSEKGGLQKNSGEGTRRSNTRAASR